MKTLQGVIHGKTIELESEPGLPDGQPVVVTIERDTSATKSASQEFPPRVEAWCNRIVFDSSVSPTEKVIRGTSLLAESLVSELERGSSLEQLKLVHPELTIDDLNALQDYARTPAGIRRSFGAWAEDSEELDEYLAWNRRRRKISRPETEE